MSKININNGLFNFLKKHKIKIIAGSMLAIALSIPATNKTETITSNPRISTSVSDSGKDYYQNRKEHIEQNIDNIKVIKTSDGFYKIIEDIYKEVPVYRPNVFGTMTVAGYEVENTGMKISYIKYSLADYLNLTELLESKVITDKTLVKYYNE